MTDKEQSSPKTLPDPRDEKVEIIARNLIGFQGSIAAAESILARLKHEAATLEAAVTDLYQDQEAR